METGVSIWKQIYVVNIAYTKKGFYNYRFAYRYGKIPSEWKQYL